MYSMTFTTANSAQLRKCVVLFSVVSKCPVRALNF